MRYGRLFVEIHSSRDLGAHNVVGWMRDDPIGNLFAIYDLVHDPANTIVYLVKGEGPRSYLLLYGGLNYHVAILRGSREAAGSLLNLLPRREMVLFTDPHLLPTVKGQFHVDSVFEEDLMVFDGEVACDAKTGIARRLVVEDSPKVAELYSRSRGEGESPHSYDSWIGRHVVYGVFEGEALDSVGGTWAETEDGWMLGGIYTHPALRKRGFATQVTSALTSGAQSLGRKAALYVVSDNKPAVRLYEKIGYRRTGERLWLGLGADVKPLTD